MGLGYRPALDGIRGLAIAVVVAAHATGWPPGGYLGVDLFFALSGFLITTLLLEEHAATGRVSLRGFYERRARRLLPALGLVLLAYAVAELAAGRDPIGPVLEGVFYCTNFFVAFGQSNPLTPLWSLAQEEQFYSLWPIVLIVLLRWRERSITPLLLAGFMLSALLALVIAPNHFLAAVYVPFARADGLIAGCLVAWWRARGKARPEVYRSVVVAGLPIVALGLATPAGSGLRLLELPAIAVFFAALVFLAVENEKLSLVLSWRPLVALGVSSYSLYLWHDPILFAFHAHGAWSGLRTVSAAVLALAVAAASTHFVEMPIRRHRSARVDQESTSSLELGGALSG